LKTQGVYNIPCEYDKVYIGQTGHSIPALESTSGTYKLNFRENQPWLSTASIWDTASSSRMPVSSPINQDTWTISSGRQLRLSFIPATGTERMAPVK
jgi:hypothetical protein